MAQRSATPPFAQSRDGTPYLVLDDFGEVGSAYRETDAAQADRKTGVADLLSGQYRYPCTYAFKTADGWARDASAEIARQVLTWARARLEHELPAAVRDVAER